MESQHSIFDEHQVIHDLKHYLPAQAPLKDFIHYNTLHAFQNLKFKDGVRYASEILGYRSSLSLGDYRRLFETGQINPDVLDRVIREKKGDAFDEWKAKVTTHEYHNTSTPRIGAFRSQWKKCYRIDMDSLVQPILFRILCSYLDQGIAIWNFPIREQTFLASLREMEKKSLGSFFRKKRARAVTVGDHM